MKRKLKKNPESLNEVVQDIYDDIQTIKDGEIKEKYEKDLDNRIKVVLRLETQYPITKKEKEIILGDFNKFWKKVQESIKLHKQTRKWKYL